MKKIVKIFLIFLFCLLIFSISKDVKANSINKIEMDTYVDNNENATVNEPWICRTNSGTELYHSYYNLGTSKIENLKVKEYGRRSNSPKSLTEKIVSEIVLFFILIIFEFIFIGLIALIDASRLHFGKEGKKMPSNLPYYRDIPCNKDLFRAYYIGYHYGLLRNKTDLFGAIILKWMKESIIRIEQKEEGGIFKKENEIIYLNANNPDTTITNKTERRLFDMLYAASHDGILESKEFKKWCKKSYSKVLTWFDNILIEQKKIMVEEGMISVRKRKILKVIKTMVYTASPAWKQEAIQLAGLKKFLKEYTLIKDKEAVEATLFEEYLIYAQMMGIAEQVKKEFKDIYPEIIKQSNFEYYDHTKIINSFIAHGIIPGRGAESKARDYSADEERGDFGKGEGGKDFH